MENVQLKKQSKSIVIDKTNRKATSFGVQVKNSKAQVKGDLGNVRVQFTFAALAVNVTLSLAPLICKVQNYVEIVVGNLNIFSNC